jgi:hypothetical protein
MAIETPIVLDWSCDCDEQPELMADNLEVISDLQTDINDNIRPQIIIYSPSIPGQGFWESEWLRQGKTLPITDGASLLWYDTSNARFGGSFTVISGVVVPVTYTRQPGTIYSIVPFLAITNENTALGSNFADTIATFIPSNGTLLDSIPSRLRFYLSFYSAAAIRWSYSVLGSVVTQNYHHTQFGTAANTDGYGEFSGGTFATNWIPQYIRHTHPVTLTGPSTLQLRVSMFSPGGAGGGVRGLNYQASLSASAGLRPSHFTSLVYGFYTLEVAQ